jgi:hypothetical protein
MYLKLINYLDWCVGYRQQSKKLSHKVFMSNMIMRKKDFQLIPIIYKYDHFNQRNLNTSGDIICKWVIKLIIFGDVELGIIVLFAKLFNKKMRMNNALTLLKSKSLIIMTIKIILWSLIPKFKNMVQSPKSEVMANNNNNLTVMITMIILSIHQWNKHLSLDNNPINQCLLSIY